MSSFHGNFFVRSTDLLSLAAVPMDQSYAIEIQIEDPISAPFVVFQTAVLHTTCYGERRIRVITLALPTTTSMSELYSSVDTVAMATLLTDKAVERSMGSKLEDARDAVSNKLVDILGTYKANMTSTGSGASPALAICENMKFLPLLMLGLLKHVSNVLPHSIIITFDLIFFIISNRLELDKVLLFHQISDHTLKLFSLLYLLNFLSHIFILFSIHSIICQKK